MCLSVVSLVLTEIRFLIIPLFSLIAVKCKPMNVHSSTDSKQASSRGFEKKKICQFTLTAPGEK